MIITWPQVIVVVIGCAMLAGIIAYFFITKKGTDAPPPDHWTDHFDSKKARK